MSNTSLLRQQLLQSLQRTMPAMVAHVSVEAPPTAKETQRARTQAATKVYARNRALDTDLQGPVAPGSVAKSGFMPMSAIVREMTSHEIPTKRRAKPKKLTRHTPSWFNAAALKGVPGASRNGINILAMQDAAETGTQVIDDTLKGAAALRERLTRSAQNCDTTKGNYILSITEKIGDTYDA